MNAEPYTDATRCPGCGSKSCHNPRIECDTDSQRAYTDADVQAAIHAYWGEDADGLEDPFMIRALDAVAPAIAARAKAETLRQCADLLETLRESERTAATSVLRWGADEIEAGR